MISFIMCHRKKGNTNSNLPRFIQSIKDNVSNIKNIEILIKVDNDDNEAVILRDDDLEIKYIVTPRRRGYADLHLGYQDLRELVSDKSKIISAVADDFVCVKKDFDLLFDIEKEYFIVEGCNEHSFSKENEFVDPNPFWSRKLLDLCDWDFITFATDMWSYRIQCELNGLSIFLGEKIFERKVDLSIDWKDGSRWNNERSEMLSIVKSREFDDNIKKQAKKIHDERFNSN